MNLVNQELVGTSIIGQTRATGPGGHPSGKIFHGVNARTGEQLEPAYHSAAAEDLDRAACTAAAAFPIYREVKRQRKAEFLRGIAAEIEALGDQLIDRVVAESALPEGRVRGERGRTCFQLRLFAGIVEEGSWVDARIDTADPQRQPLPKPDLRSMLRPLGPVVVFCASNFPLAFSVAGGDTASALAAGCPVVVKAHHSHPGTAELVGIAIQRAAAKTSMPEGVFSLLYGEGAIVGHGLLSHPLIRGGGFTGSRKGGLELLEAARRRPEPIPFYAEMSSVNPVFILPHALQERGPQIAAGLHGSVTLGVGQFCTNPGLIVTPAGRSGDELAAALAQKMRATEPAAMLNSTILQSYCRGVEARAGDVRVRCLAPAAVTAAKGQATATPALFETELSTFLDLPELAEEIFGPESILVRSRDLEEMLALARSMEPNLTATIHMAAGDEEAARQLVAVLETRVGRILFQGYPTGVEVCQAMVHGGPYPSTSDGHSTSVGGRAIDRWARAVCFQDTPPDLLPLELRDGNPAGIWRIVDGARGRS
jgi:NADP-dependent aldehyde dehydrogenase